MVQDFASPLRKLDPERNTSQRPGQPRCRRYRMFSVWGLLGVVACLGAFGWWKGPLPADPSRAWVVVFPHHPARASTAGPRWVLSFPSPQPTVLKRMQARGWDVDEADVASRNGWTTITEVRGLRALRAVKRAQERLRTWHVEASVHRV